MSSSTAPEQLLAQEAAQAMHFTSRSQLPRESGHVKLADSGTRLKMSKEDVVQWDTAAQTLVPLPLQY